MSEPIYLGLFQKRRAVFFHGHRYFFRSYGKLPEPFAGGVINGVGYGGGGGVYDYLSDGLGSEGAFFLVTAFKDDVYMPDVKP